ncbi:MAG: hypothetical protein JWO17_1631 [Actinomycetia bacterium]|nr:hypothetical protein [Actinomycetes bacterium]
MSIVTRHLLPTVVIGVAVVLTVGFFAFARPQYHPPNQGEEITIKVPPEHPATGWTWAEGTPGFKAGTMLGKRHDFNITFLQPVEVAAAQLAAAHALLDADGVRVLNSIRTDLRGPLAILAAPTIGETPARTCLAVMLRGTAPAHWRCPHDLAGSHVLVAAASSAASVGSAHPLFVIGVASGDVQRIVLIAAPLGKATIYTRGTTWGQFEASASPPTKDGAQLLVYGNHGLLQKLTLSVAPGGQRIFD